MIFTKSGRYKNLQMKYFDNLIDNVKQYTYLGIVFNSCGSFTMDRNEILNKGMKAMFKFRKTFSLDTHGVNTLLHVLITL